MLNRFPVGRRTRQMVTLLGVLRHALLRMATSLSRVMPWPWE